MHGRRGFDSAQCTLDVSSVRRRLSGAYKTKCGSSWEVVPDDVANGIPLARHNYIASRPICAAAAAIRYARRTSLVRHDAPDAVKHLPVALYCTASGRRQRGGVVGGLRLGPTGGGMRRLMTPSGRPLFRRGGAALLDGRPRPLSRFTDSIWCHNDFATNSQLDHRLIQTF